MKMYSVATSIALAVSSLAFAQGAVQWRIQDRGNGHWYQGVREASGIAWEAASAAAAARGGHLASVTSAQENQFIISTVIPTLGPFGSEFGPILGGRYANGSWLWVTGEPWSFTAWVPGEPSSPSFEPYLHYQLPTLGWNDYDGGDGTSYSAPFRTSIVEWSADCNSDGLVDYGQILQGQLADSNSNGIPDVCEIDPCPGDVSRNGLVNGIDLAAVLDAWGTDGQGKFDCDINNDGLVNGADLSIVLSDWGVCP
jgi:hypothetical protein